jgi:hypothetical protein
MIQVEERAIKLLRNHTHWTFQIIEYNIIEGERKRERGRDKENIIPQTWINYEELS